jgi:putative ABC transport system permease protein
MNILILSRRIVKNRRYFITNILGLSLALSSLILVFSFVKNELSYDRFHSKADRICRITQNTNTGVSSMIDARFFTDYYQDIIDKNPEVEHITGLSSFRKAIITVGENSFYSKKAFRADSSFFEVFDFELLTGDKKTIFKIPGQAAISESIAKTYFGTIDVAGKQLKILHQRNRNAETYIIKAVFKDFPENSHIKADVLCSFPEIKYSYWVYTYALLAQNTDCKSLQEKIQKQWDTDNKENETHPLINLQPLTDIHLHSHKTREMEPNGNVSALILLISGVLIILIVAFINFLNLNYVRFLSEIENVKIKIINGASRLTIAKEFLYEMFVLVIFVVAISLYFIAFLVDYLHFDFHSSIVNMGFVILLFVLLTLLIAFVPVLYHKSTPMANLVSNNNRIYRLSLIVQLLLSIVAISSTLFIQKQINFTNEIHPKAKDANVIVIPDNPKGAVAKFELLKEKLLKYPEIISACGVSEEPGGTVVDNFAYTYDGDTTGNDKTLNVLIVDEDFFTFMDIQPIAGTVDLGKIPSYEWERNAIRLWYAEMGEIEMPENADEIKNYQEKYILNKSALAHIGIKNPQDAIGKQFRIIHSLKYLFPPGIIIGVVDDFHYTNVHEKVKPLVIMPRKLFCHNFLFRLDTNNKQKAISLIETQWNKINEGIPFNYEFISDSYRKVYKNEYMQMKVLLFFAIISILLSLIGMYAMIRFKLKLQTKEIGIRKVNGASTFEIVKMLNKDFIILTLIAFVISIPVIYFAMQKWLENFAYKTVLSGWVFAIAGLFVLIVTVLIISWNSFRVARQNPVDSLKYE